MDTPVIERPTEATETRLVFWPTRTDGTHVVEIDAEKRHRLVGWLWIDAEVTV